MKRERLYAFSQALAAIERLYRDPDVDVDTVDMAWYAVNDLFKQEKLMGEA